MIEKEKVVCFLEYTSTHRAASRKRCQINFADWLSYVSDGRFLVEAYCYIPIDPRNEHRLDREIEALWQAGYLVLTKPGNVIGRTYTCSFAVEMTMDILRVVHEVGPEIVVLATNDANFVPLILDLRKRGIRVEVAAFAGATSEELLLHCSGFIDLALYYEDYLAAQQGEQDEERVQEQYHKLIQSQEPDLQELLSEDVELSSDREDEKMSASLAENVPERSVSDELQKLTADNEGGESHGDY